jgi:2-dehydro-3-deoxyphosphooctonate aldolase (KDO 8-P synthase)
LESGLQKRINVGGVEFGGAKLALIAGPCVIESREACLRTAEELKRLSDELAVPFVFKASYLKANRTSAHSFQGPGIERGLEILADVKKKTGVPVLSDVHCREEVRVAAEVLDLLQIPAFLCRQTHLVEACGKTGLPVNVKKGQFLAPDDAKYILEKLALSGCTRVLLTERGTCFGYHNLVVDMRAIETMRSMGVPVVFDVTHSLQRPGGERTGGDRSSAATLARAAVAAGCDALFVETHAQPEKSLSDAETVLPLKGMRDFLKDMLLVREAYLGCSWK